MQIAPLSPLLLFAILSGSMLIGGFIAVKRDKEFFIGVIVGLLVGFIIAILVVVLIAAMVIGSKTPQ